MAFLTFKGGVHPPEKKELSENKEIKALPLPNEVFIYLSNHLGTPAKPIVEVGQKVKTGQMIAQAEGFISANIHSSVTGEITEITEMINAATGKKDKIIVIKRTSDDEWHLFEEIKDFKKETSEVLIQRIKDSGIVGLGGAMFPTHVKLSIPKGKKADTLIINSAECEPYITIDDRMMIERTQEIFKGIEIIMHIIGAQHTYVGVENNTPKAIKSMEEAAKNDQIDVVKLQTKYPQGAEKQLIKAITNKEVPSGKLPIDIGIVVVNVSTAFAVYEAVFKGKPLVERGISLTGEGVKEPGNYIFRIGTKVKELLDVCGLVEEDKIDRILYGGPMMGIPLPDINLSTFKGNNALTVMTKDVVKTDKTYPCIRCSACVMVCPTGLQPYLMKKLLDNRKQDDAKEIGIMDCIECGACSYICPSHIDLAKTFKTSKKIIRIMSQRKGK